MGKVGGSRDPTSLGKRIEISLAKQNSQGKRIEISLKKPRIDREYGTVYKIFCVNKRIEISLAK